MKYPIETHSRLKLTLLSSPIFMNNVCILYTTIMFKDVVLDVGRPMLTSTYFWQRSTVTTTDRQNNKWINTWTRNFVSYIPLNRCIQYQNFNCKLCRYESVCICRNTASCVLRKLDISTH
jgi:hypothetical protein